VVLFLSILEVFDYLFPNKVKSTLGVNVYYSTLGNFEFVEDSRIRNKAKTL